MLRSTATPNQRKGRKHERTENSINQQPFAQRSSEESAHDSLAYTRQKLLEIRHFSLIPTAQPAFLRCRGGECLSRSLRF